MSHLNQVSITFSETVSLVGSEEYILLDLIFKFCCHSQYTSIKLIEKYVLYCQVLCGR